MPKIKNPPRRTQDGFSCKYCYCLLSSLCSNCAADGGERKNNDRCGVAGLSGGSGGSGSCFGNRSRSFGSGSFGSRSFFGHGNFLDRKIGDGIVFVDRDYLICRERSFKYGDFIVIEIESEFGVIYSGAIVADIESISVSLVIVGFAGMTFIAEIGFTLRNAVYIKGIYFVCAVNNDCDMIPYSVHVLKR